MISAQNNNSFLANSRNCHHNTQSEQCEESLHDGLLSLEFRTRSQLYNPSIMMPIHDRPYAWYSPLVGLSEVAIGLVRVRFEENAVRYQAETQGQLSPGVTEAGRRTEESGAAS